MVIPSRSATLSNQFVGDGEYDLCLKIGQLIELQEKTNAGPYVLANRLMNGTWMVEDVIETIRLGLIGGGLDPRSAYSLVTRYIVEGSIFQYSGLAGELVLASILGVPDEQPDGNEDADPQPASTSADSFVGANSMNPLGPQE